MTPPVVSHSDLVEAYKASVMKAIQESDVDSIVESGVVPVPTEAELAQEGVEGGLEIVVDMAQDHLPYATYTIPVPGAGIYWLVYENSLVGKAPEQQDGQQQLEASPPRPPATTTTLENNTNERLKNIPNELANEWSSESELEVPPVKQPSGNPSDDEE